MADGSRTLTTKGQATRGRIVEAAAELFYDHGITQTTNTDIRTAAGVSGSQLNHYFPTREALVDAVLQVRLSDAVHPTQARGAGMPDSLAALQRWRDSYIKRYQRLHGGCKVGSLAGELLKSPLHLNDRIADGYESWRQALEDGVQTMKDNGELTDDADATYLSHVLLSALQGGLLLTQAMRSTAALEAALDGALEVVHHYAAGDPQLG